LANYPRNAQEGDEPFIENGFVAVEFLDRAIVRPPPHRDTLRDGSLFLVTWAIQAHELG
jgi:hypothetical protein